jgi:hypothetical protein
MDSYMCYTHTIHQEARNRLHHRRTTAPAYRHAQPSPAAHMPQHHRLRLALSDLLSTVRRRVLTARYSTAPSTPALLTTSTEEAPASE